MTQLQHDAIVIGGGPAGLQAAHTLGRVHRSTLLIDAGHGRNERAEHMHNFATHDGRPPAEYRALARADLEAYPVDVLDTTVSAVRQDADGGFVVTADGTEHRGRRLLLATGMRDVIPDIDGIERFWGTHVMLCPFCHGHEFAGRRVAILGTGDHATRVRAILSGIGADVVVVTEQVTAMEDADDGVWLLGPQEPVEVAGVFVGTTALQAAPFAEELGAELLEDGCVAIDGVGRTTVPRLFAAGDAAHQRGTGAMAAVLLAAASGQLAASGVLNDLLQEEAG